MMFELDGITPANIVSFATIVVIAVCNTSFIRNMKSHAWNLGGVVAKI